MTSTARSSRKPAVPLVPTVVRGAVATGPEVMASMLAIVGNAAPITRGSPPQRTEFRCDMSFDWISGSQAPGPEYCGRSVVPDVSNAP
jgi:hypothetical protein